MTPLIFFLSLAFSKINRSFGADASLEDRRAAFQFNAYTLWATMAGQMWPEGDRDFYARLRVPVLLICGCLDRLVSEEEEEETLFVSFSHHFQMLVTRFYYVFSLPFKGLFAISPFSLSVNPALFPP